VYSDVYRAAYLLTNHDAQDASALAAAYATLVAEMTQQHGHGPLAGAMAHFAKVTQSYEPGLFHCYDVPDLPRTNNDLEQFFGSARYHERRATGRRGASPALVVRGAVRLLAAVITPQRTFVGADLRPHNLDAWRRVRQQMAVRQDSRRLQGRFRKDPVAYLAKLEAQLLQPSLPP